MGSPSRALVLVENLSVPFDRRVWQECTALRDEGWDVQVICPVGDGRDTAPQTVIDGVTVHRYQPRPATRGRAGYLGEYVTALWHMWRLAKRIRSETAIDVVHLCNPPDVLFLVCLFLKLRGARVLFDQHDLTPELYLSRFDRGKDLIYWCTRLAELITYRVADVVVAPNETYRDVAMQRGRVRRSRTFVVRSAPAIADFRPVAPDPSLFRGQPHLICYLGVMGPQDGVDLALRALAHLATLRQDWHAVFIGAGDELPAAKLLTAELGLSHLVRFTGRIPDADLLRHLSSATVCLAADPLNPLNDVSSMNKVVEYMALGRPIVCFDLREARVSAGDAAVYARPNSTSHFGDLVGELLDDPDRRERMGIAGRERVSGALSWEHSKLALIAAYDAATRDPRHVVHAARPASECR